MNVLMIKPAGGVSGAEVYNLSLILGLRKTFPEVKLIYITNYLPFAEDLREAGVDTYTLQTGVKEIGTKKDLVRAILLSSYFIFQYFSLLRKLEKQEKIDMVCLQSMTEKILLTPLLALVHCKIIWLEHGPIFRTERAIVIKRLYSMLSKLVRQIIAVSEDTKQDLITGGINKDAITIIPASIDIAYFLPPPNKNRKKSKFGFGGKIVVGYSGKINREKGIEGFIDVAELMIKKNKNIVFLLVGDGPYELWVKEKVKALHIEKYFQFVGFQEDVKKYLEVMDIFFFPTNHYEGLSLALLEAAAMELLILTHDIGGNREVVIDGKTGFLYRDFSTDKVADTLDELIHKYHTYEKIRKNARELLKQKYDTKITAKAFHDVCIALV